MEPRTFISLEDYLAKRFAVQSDDESFIIKIKQTTEIHPGADAFGNNIQRSAVIDRAGKETVAEISVVGLATYLRHTAVECGLHCGECLFKDSFREDVYPKYWLEQVINEAISNQPLYNDVLSGIPEGYLYKF